MPDTMKRVLDPVTTRWNSLTRPQHFKIAGVICALIIALGVTLFLALRPSWVALIANRDIMEIAPMQLALNEQGIRNRTNTAGTTLYVDRRDRLDAQVIITAEYLVPQDDAFTWPDALDTGLGTTDSERRLREIRATEGAIARQMTTVQGIVSAFVNLNAPVVRPFDETAPPPTASIQLTTTRQLTVEDGRNLARMAAGAVNGLTIDNITIMDQNLRLVFSGDQDLQVDAQGIAAEAQVQHTNRIEWALSRMFLHIFDQVTPVVNLVFDSQLFNEELSEVFTIPDGMEGEGIGFEVREIRTEVEGAPGTGLAPGVEANMQVAGYQFGAEGTMRATQREIDHSRHVNLVRTVTQTGAGWVDTDASTVAITAFISHDINQDLWLAEEDGRNDQDWERFKQDNARARTVNSDFTSFDYVIAAAAAAAGIPVSNVELIVFEGYNFIDVLPGAIPWPLIVMLGVLGLLLGMLLYGLLLRQKVAEDEEEAEPELSVEDLLVSTQLEDEKEEEAKQLDEIDYFKENEIKKHIEKFVNEKPEAVAALLRNWINVEEW